METDKLRIVYKHFRFLGTGGVNARETESYVGLHGRAYHYQRGVTKNWRPSERGGYTHCYIKLGDDLVWWGIAQCSKKDHFSYAAGRSLALRRALGSWLSLPEEVWGQLGVREVT